MEDVHPGDSAAWLNALRGSGPARDQAVAALYALLVRAGRAEVARRRSSVGDVRADELEDIATQAADAALVAVLSKLDDYGGASRFTTWASKFALLEAGVRVRRRAWQHREVVLDADSWTRLAEPAAALDLNAEHGEVIRALANGIGENLTSHQRRVLVCLALDRVPIDVLAERLNMTRGALYKTLHDARRRLRGTLAERGFSVDAA